MRGSILSSGRRTSAALVLAAALLVAGGRAPGATPPATAPTASASALVIVVSARSPLRDISRKVLRRAYLGEATEEQGIRLAALNHPPGSPARVAFDRTLLNLEPEAMARFWIDQRIRGQGSAPRSIPSVALLLRVLAQLPGGVSYVRRSDLPANAPGVKVLTIDGKQPGDPGYLFP